MKQKQKGFTLIELIVVMAIITILVLIAAPKFMGYTEKAKLTQVINDIKVSEKAAEQYYLQNDLWPRDQTAIPYTVTQLNTWVDDFRNLSGETVTLEPGDYYDVDWDKLKGFMDKPNNNFKYIIQNPVGDIYYANDLTPAGEQTKLAGENQVTTEPEPTTEVNVAPTAVITMTPETNLLTTTTITWSTSNSTDPDGDLITNVEWEGKQDIYATAGSYTVRLRVQDEHGLWSEWTEKTFTITPGIVYSNYESAVLSTIADPYPLRQNKFIGNLLYVTANYTYGVNLDNTFTIVAYTGSSVNVVLPDKINGVLVTGLDKYQNTQSTMLFNNTVISVNLPKGLTRIDNKINFGNQIQNVYISDDNLIYKVINGVLFSKDGTVLVMYPLKKGPTYTVPLGTLIISEYSFYKCYLTSVVIPVGVTTIKSAAFYLNNLSTVLLPNTLVTIGDNTFAANVMTSVTIPNSVQSIGSGGFTKNLFPNGSVKIDNQSGVVNMQAWSFSRITSGTRDGSNTTQGVTPVYLR